MNKRLSTLIVAALGMMMMMSNSGCAIVSASSTSKDSSGSVWYVKRYVIGNDKVYYCPPDQNEACYEATITK